MPKNQPASKSPYGALLFGNQSFNNIQNQIN